VTDLGLFAEWQPRYAAHRIPTFPVLIDRAAKRPAVKGYLKLGSDSSRQLVMRFAHFEAFGFAVGRRSGITVLDVDSPDERLLADAMARHGTTPVIVRSVSGHFQAWYRHAGESRLIRPFRNQPIDILGGGYVVAPPSMAKFGRYEFLQGRLDDIASLPAMQHVPRRSPTEEPVAPRGGDIGRRNDVLFRDCLRASRACRDVDEIIAFAIKRNAEFSSPLDREEAVKTAESAWRYEERGLNFARAGQVVPISHTEIDELMAQSPDAVILLMLLRRSHWARDFVVANPMAKQMPGGAWSRTRFSAARSVLENAGKIELVRHAGRGTGPAVYRWPVRKGCQDSNTNKKHTPAPASSSPSSIH
jgi:hypothetical protein